MLQLLTQFFYGNVFNYFVVFLSDFFGGNYHEVLLKVEMLYVVVCGCATVIR